VKERENVEGKKRKKGRETRRAVCIISLAPTRSSLIFAPSFTHQLSSFRLDSGVISGELMHGRLPSSKDSSAQTQPANDKSDFSLECRDFRLHFLDELESC
jgi:hypothetical protein